MILVLAAIAIMGWLLWLLRAPRSLFNGLLFVAAAFLIVVHLTLPVDHALRQSTGGSLFAWWVLGLIVAIVWGYSRILKRARAAHKKIMRNDDTGSNQTFSDPELERYARHIVLREIGGQGQKKLKKSSVLIVGAGGLGSPAALYLVAAGVGKIGIIDEDVVSLSNLQRQILFSPEQDRMPKVQAAGERLKNLNSFVDIKPYERRLTEDIALDLISEYDLVLDGTDNFPTRALVNKACVQGKKGLISGAISQWEGQISLFNTGGEAPCYACVFPDEPASGQAPTCAEAGVAGPLPGVIGSMMALEAVKYLSGAGEGLSGRMIIYDGLYGDFRVIRLKRNSDCSVCALPETEGL